ncbi:MAG: hypothetical protein LBI09_02325 [Nitrososphaerota archaeon]|nr:hypothetical protein [Nitrososphaerota archaeon]
MPLGKMGIILSEKSLNGSLPQDNARIKLHKLQPSVLDEITYYNGPNKKTLLS